MMMKLGTLIILLFNTLNYTLQKGYFLLISK